MQGLPSSRACCRNADFCLIDNSLALASLANMSEKELPQNCIAEYACKVLCGHITLSGTNIPPCVPGWYASAVNIHNPSPKDTVLWAKFAHATENQGGGVSPWHQVTLKPDQAMELDCTAIRKAAQEIGLQNPPFLKGFLVIQSQSELDIVTVYTAATDKGGHVGDVASLHTERVPMRRLG